MEIYHNDEDFAYNLMFFDETSFRSNGAVNRYNCCYCSIDNVHWIQEAHPQTLNVWNGIFMNRIANPCYIYGTLARQKYLRDSVAPTLKGAFIVQ